MKTTFTLFFFFLVAGIRPVAGQLFPIDTLQYTGPDSNRIVLVLLGDGYRDADMAAFRRDAERVTGQLFTTVPFREYRSFFNVYAIEAPSPEEGADHPGTATDVTEPAHPLHTADTRFGASFDYFNIHRLLVATDWGAVQSVLLQHLPQYDQTLILVNSPFYGGSGGTFPTTSAEAQAPEIAIHELGHSFAQLADEYYAGDFYASERANMTRENSPRHVRWHRWINEEGVGVYQHCCGGESAQWRRPHEDCKMRYLGRPFCAVCREAIIDRIYQLVSPIDAASPGPAGVSFTGDPLDFSITEQRPSPNTLEIRWFLNDEPLAGDTTAVRIDGPDLPLAENRLTAQVLDQTPLSRTYQFPQGYLFERQWVIRRGDPTNTPSAPVTSRLRYRVFPNPTAGELFVEYEADHPIPSLRLLLVDAAGRTVLRRQAPLAAGSHTAAFDLAALPAGAYTVVLELPRRRETFTLVKE